MSRLIDLELRTGMIWISSPYDPTVNALIKTIPGRSFDSKTKRWGVPMAEIALVIEKLEPLHFRFTPRMREWWLENRAEGPPSERKRDRPDVREVDPKDGFTVSRLNDAARRAITDAFGDEMWVVAELESYERNSSGHAYFELIDRVVAGGEVIAKVSAVMFSSTRQRIVRELDDIELTDGMMVRMRGRLDIYSPHGRYQFVVEGIDAEWSAGALRRRRDQILRKLEERGLLEQNLGRDLPTCPLRVGLITALESDAYNDFVHELERSELAFELTVHPAKMQGRDTERSVTEALAWFAARSGDFDVIVVTRGGGSRTDLSHFDSLAIGEAVCRHPVKVIAGIGHHRDRCVLDFAAHSEKTPTAAAQLLVSRVRHLLERFDVGADRAVRAVERRLDSSNRRLGRAGSRLERKVAQRLKRAEERCIRSEIALRDGTRALLVRRSGVVDRLAEATRDGARSVIRDASMRVDFAARTVAPARVARATSGLNDRVDDLVGRLGRAVQSRLASATLNIEHAEATLRLADPRRVLERGYALVRDAEGAIVMDAAEVAALDEAHVELRDGVVVATPTKTTGKMARTTKGERTDDE